MKKYFLAISILSFLFLSACAVGPLVTHETAQTVGSGHHELAGGYGNPGFVVKYNYGLTEHLDLGVQWETLSIGLRAKFAFLQSHERGLALAVAAGLGSSLGGSHYYADFLVSYLFGKLEPYATIRVVYVRNDPTEFRNKDTGALVFFVSQSQYSYGQGFFGSRIWLGPNWYISVEGSSLFTLGTGLNIGSNFLYSGALGYRF